MTWKRSILVVANITATSEALLAELTRRAQREPLIATLIVPATSSEGGREAARAQLQAALESLRAAGIEADGLIGDSDPILAVSEAWDPKRYDEIIVSTLPMSESKWLHAGLPERIGKLTGAAVTHVAVPPPRAEAHTVVRKPEQAHLGIVTPLAGLWRRRT
ncbi:MAG TPA: hypothetical protein VG223_04310 [Solirubrobacteraceae bacterium]|jgi:GABA permease|nr:hypothetical protein [Solirubrobacteraceae bacterium]